MNPKQPKTSLAVGLPVMNEMKSECWEVSAIGEKTRSTCTSSLKLGEMIPKRGRRSSIWSSDSLNDGLLEEEGNDFYSLTEKGRAAIEKPAT